MARQSLTNVMTSATAIYENSDASFPTRATGAATSDEFLSELGRTQTSISFTTGTSSPRKGADTVSVDELSGEVAVFTAVDSDGFCWVGALNEGTSALNQIPRGQAFNATPKTITSGATCKASHWAATRTNWVNAFATVRTLPGVTGVFFGTTMAASFHVTSATTITAVSKAHVSGSVPISVTTSYGRATSTSEFRFTPT
jgi:hypothetical protein